MEYTANVPMALIAACSPNRRDWSSSRDLLVHGSENAGIGDPDRSFDFGFFTNSCDANWRSHRQNNGMGLEAILAQR